MATLLGGSRDGHDFSGVTICFGTASTTGIFVAAALDGTPGATTGAEDVGCTYVGIGRCGIVAGARAEPLFNSTGTFADV